MKKRRLGLCLLIVAALVCALGFTLLQNDENCTLCAQPATNGPCIIDLNTGAIHVISIYDADPEDPTHINAAKTKYGNAEMRVLNGLGSCFSLPDEHYATVSIQMDCVSQYSYKTARQFFCDECLGKIDAINPSCSVIFADCYNKDQLALYALESAQDGVDIRHYTIIVEEQDELSLHLKLTSSYFSGGSELDY